MPQEAMQILQAIAARYPITGADMMEIAPFTDSSGLGIISQEKTLKVAGEISAFLISKINK
jgi:agmatinase